MKSFNLITKSVAHKLCSTLALVLISGSLYAGGGIWQNNNSKSGNSKNNNSSKFGNNKNIFNKNNSHNNQKGNKPGKGGSNGDSKHGGKSCKTNSVPLDGGLSILLLGAAAFGVKKLRDNS